MPAGSAMLEIFAKEVKGGASNEVRAHAGQEAVPDVAEHPRMIQRPTQQLITANSVWLRSARSAPKLS